eukprot:scaffold11172_cov46-Prasinocladus_malaysianus.AAC.3
MPGDGGIVVSQRLHGRAYSPGQEPCYVVTLIYVAVTLDCCARKRHGRKGSGRGVGAWSCLALRVDCVDRCWSIGQRMGGKSRSMSQSIPDRSVWAPGASFYTNDVTHAVLITVLPSEVSMLASFVENSILDSMRRRQIFRNKLNCCHVKK